MGARRIGVEEEMFLVDPESRRLIAASHHVAEESAGGVEQELFLQQVETTTHPHADLVHLQRDLVRARRVAADAADASGAALVAVASPVMPDADGETTPKNRYRSMLSTFGQVGRQALVCATHVHVEVAESEAIGVIDDLRPWLPLLVAISANSPFDHGVDTGYASWRQQVWDAWPSAGPVEPFVDADGYRDAVRALVASGAAIDEAMVYFDVRVARDFPTVELRVADVCTDLDDTVLVAEVARALVETAVRERERDGLPEPWRVDLLRAARWRARHDGLTGSLVHPVTRSSVPAAEALEALCRHVRPVLEDHGTTDLVADGLHRLLERGTGSEQQRRVAADGTLTDVVDDLIARTRQSYEELV